MVLEIEPESQLKCHMQDKYLNFYFTSLALDFIYIGGGIYSSASRLFQAQDDYRRSLGESHMVDRVKMGLATLQGKYIDL